MKPKIWKDKKGWHTSYQLNHWGINEIVYGTICFDTWSDIVEFLQRYHKVIQWPTKPNAL